MLVQQEVDGVALVPVLEYVGRVLEVELLVLVVASDHVEDRVAGGCHRRRSAKEVCHDVSSVSEEVLRYAFFVLFASFFIFLR